MLAVRTVTFFLLFISISVLAQPNVVYEPHPWELNLNTVKENRPSSTSVSEFEEPIGPLELEQVFSVRLVKPLPVNRKPMATAGGTQFKCEKFKCTGWGLPSILTVTTCQQLATGIGVEIAEFPGPSGRPFTQKTLAACNSSLRTSISGQPYQVKINVPLVWTGIYGETKQQPPNKSRTGQRLITTGNLVLLGERVSEYGKGLAIGATDEERLRDVGGSYLIRIPIYRKYYKFTLKPIEIGITCFIGHFAFNDLVTEDLEININCGRVGCFVGKGIRGAVHTIAQLDPDQYKTIAEIELQCRGACGSMNMVCIIDNPMSIPNYDPERSVARWEGCLHNGKEACETRTRPYYLPHENPIIGCEGTVSNLSINPNNRPCLIDCQCNSQKFTGQCVNGRCLSFEREQCTAEGAVRSCIDPITKCKGRQMCKPSYLKNSKWGDCVCQVADR